MRWWQQMRNPSLHKAGVAWTLLRQARLAFRLLRDQRVPMAAKAIVPATFLYLASPLDFVPDLIPLLGQVDDLGLLLVGITAFIKLCPRPLVEEHEADLEGRPMASSGRNATPYPRGEEPVDARYRWVDERPSR